MHIAEKLNPLVRRAQVTQQRHRQTTNDIRTAHAIRRT